MQLRRPLLAGCLTVLFVLWSIMMIFNPPPWDSELSHLEGERIEVTGRVYHKECKQKYNKQVKVFYLKSCDIKSLNQDKFQCDNLICEVPYEDDVRIGMELRVQGTLTLFSHATNPGEFDLADYYAGQGIAGCISDGAVLACGESYNRMGDMLFCLGEYLEKSFICNLGGEEAQIMSKMLLGRGEELSGDIKMLFQEGGIYHILSISGMHISMLGMGTYRFLRKRSVPLPVAAAIGSIFILLYGTMIGFGISAVRAIGMYLVHLLGDVVGRSYDMTTALGVMAVGIAIHNPKVLFSAGYLLSFSCVFCLGFFTPALTRGICKDGKGNRWLSGWATGLSISIFTLPLQLYFFYQVPVYSMFLNLLVVPFVEVLMIMGILLLIFPFAVPLKWGIRGIIGLYECLCILFSKLPGSVFIAGRPKEWSIAVFYVCVALFCLWVGRKQDGVIQERFRRRKVPGWIILVMAILLVCLPQRMQTRITFLDVGQGDCTLIQTRDGKNLLIDAGSSSRSSVGEYQIVPALKCMGVNYLDAIVVTHPDYDHYSALGDVLEVYGDRCGGIVLPAIEREKRTEEFAEVYEEIKSAGNSLIGNMASLVCDGAGKVTEGKVTACPPIYFMGAGDVLYESSGIPVLNQFFSWAKGLRLSCLAPSPQASYNGSNEYSIVLFMEYGEFSALFTGDVEGYGEDVLCDVLKESFADLGDELAREGVARDELAQDGVARDELAQDGVAAGECFAQDGQPLCERLTILKVAHHGSSGSTSEEFLRLVRPRVAVISCGRNNSYGHPHKETLMRLGEAGASVLTTPDCGAVTMEISTGGRTVRVRRWVEP